MKQFSATIINNRPICSDFFEMEFAWDKNAPFPLPGQFFTVRVTDGPVPLLRRPFAFSSYAGKKGVAAMIYKFRGRGTGMLTELRSSELLDIIGPLGRWFPMPKPGKKALLVAGGIGLGPMLFLASRCWESNVSTTFIYGCRTNSQVPSTRSFSVLKPRVCTDDGSSGFQGTAVDYLSSIIKFIDKDTHLYCCGPEPMLKGCHACAKAAGIPCWISVEQIMACGVGACMGCVVKTAGGGYKRACTEGPVFESKEIFGE